MSTASSLDPQHFIMYDPASTDDHSQSKPTDLEKHTKTIKKSDSWFSQFFVLDDGVISLSLRDMTIILSLGISGTLIAMGYIACTDGSFTCNTKTFPMISDVIISKEMYDRIFLLLTTVMMFGIQQVNIRAFYKKLYGVISDGKNDFLLDLGIASCVGLPMVGIFDEKAWGTLHGISAGIFFGCFGIYCYLLGHYLYNNKDKFPASEQRSISIIYWNTWGLMATLLLFVISPLLGEIHHFLTPVSEWAVVIYYANFFAIASYTNQYYDSVHEFGTLVKKQ